MGWSQLCVRASICRSSTPASAAAERSIRSKRFGGHEVAARRGRKVAAARQQAHRAQVDLLVPLFGVVRRAARLCERRGIEDDEVIGLFVRGLELREQSKTSAARKSILSSRPLRAAFARAISMALSDTSTAVTCSAPPLAALSANEPVCVKQSSTRLPRARCATARRLNFWSRKKPVFCPFSTSTR